MTVDPRTRAMTGIALAGATVAPAPFLRPFGTDRADVTGPTSPGRRHRAGGAGLAVVRDAQPLDRHPVLCGDRFAEAAFLPVLVLDQAVFWTPPPPVRCLAGHRFWRRPLPG
ncbi:hypothetical protein [Pseudonocardia abyssalis]|uniref:Uncharacterized protein n=1 Tax=Pseudonocardia abyssalis TaxID=2792008 RepID=A0ABS6UYD1_9PSEU|nr:hypothetical protein [Pseudonocardia abyssalis]MBW0117727.1 hypothetical protein [Pseudonocardia abyssalis]MBW0136903.1 hypothetical protein [Pseudonocardia abyssalis]